MRTINQVLDTAQRVQKVKSDYKLGLCLGIGQTSISSYRSGRSLPDEKAVEKLAAAIGEHPDLLLVEVQAQRSKDAAARRMWESLAKRLQSGFANCALLVMVAIFSIAATALPAWAAIGFVSSMVEASVYYVKRAIAVIYARKAPRPAFL